MEYSKRRNLNSGHLKLDVWQRALDLFAMAYRLAAAVGGFKLSSQFPVPIRRKMNWRLTLTRLLLRVTDPRSGARLCEAQRFPTQMRFRC